MSLAFPLGRLRFGFVLFNVLHFMMGYVFVITLCKYVSRIMITPGLHGYFSGTWTIRGMIIYVADSVEYSSIPPMAYMIILLIFTFRAKSLGLMTVWTIAQFVAMFDIAIIIMISGMSTITVFP